MNPKDTNRLHEFYDSVFTEYGTHDPRSVHWLDTDNQFLRFEILLAVADVYNSCILDVGCGLGDLYKFLLQKRITVNYTGIDIMPEFITVAREKYPEAHFELGDITTFDFKDTPQKDSQNFLQHSQFDYVLASGALSFKVENNQDYYFSIIKKMYALAGKAVAFNMLNRESHVDDDTFAAYDPIEVSDFCKTFCDNVQIVTDYLPQDFTVYLYK